MQIDEHIHSSLNLIRQNKIRSFLTMLGIIIGIMGVIVIISVGAGAQTLILEQISSRGSNLVAVFPGKSEEDGPPVSAMGIVITTLTYDDIEALKNNPRIPYLEDATGYVQGTVTVSWKGNKADSTFIGVSESLVVVEDTSVDIGNFFTKDDEKSLQKVAVLGSDVARDLFEDEDPIGQLIKMGKHTFRVSGVMAERGTSQFTNQDNQIYIPLPTAQKLMLGINHISFARGKVSDPSQIDRTMEDINEVLRERHDIGIGELEDFDVMSQTQALDTLMSITDAIRFFLAAVAGISLIVGGIGIMNIMLVSVQERIREIGLRKAVGARNSHILGQFLVETIIMTSVAGIVGVLFGIIVSYAISYIANYMGYEWKFSISLFSILIGVGVSSIVGFIFGLIPARRASKLDPIDALRYE